ncbi:MAG: hypothetical protein R3E39_09460 [Anaerolineae bacterium]
MTGINRPKKMLVRTMVVTSATVATLIGAQMLALTERQAAAHTSAVRALPRTEAVIARVAPTITLLEADEGIHVSQLAAIAASKHSKR